MVTIVWNLDFYMGAYENLILESGDEAIGTPIARVAGDYAGLFSTVPVW